MWFLILPSLIASAFAVTDPACTTDGTALTHNALACQDKDPGICAPVFGPAPGSTPAGRVATCVKEDANAQPEAGFKKLAIEKCAKFCGYCCLTPEYNCENKPYSQTGLNCTNMADKCADPTWRPLIADNCPNVCGMCLEGGCVDKAPDCASQPTICYNSNFVEWAKENCARTCNKCPPKTATTAAPTAGPPANPPAAATTRTTAPANCVDTDVNCDNWARNGKFCNNTYYQNQWYKCPKACGRC